MLLSELPMYLYHHEELPQRGDGTLFHFTKFESFLKILDDLTLLPSSFGKLNDMNKFVPHSFVTMCYDNHGYSTMDMAFKIDSVIKMNMEDALYADYYKWLHEEQGYG